MTTTRRGSLLGGEDSGIWLQTFQDDVKGEVEVDLSGMEGEGGPLALFVKLKSGAGAIEGEPADAAEAAVAEMPGAELVLRGGGAELRLEPGGPGPEEVAGEVRRSLEALPGVIRADVELSTDPERGEYLVGFRRLDDYRSGSGTTPTDEEVKVFYGCRLCQNVSPDHTCIITPERAGNCGITWSDARTSIGVNPEGGFFEIEKGEELEPGEYRGVDEAVRSETDGEVRRLNIYSGLDHPHPTCGCQCFDAVVFYVPELDGFGVVDADYGGETPLGVGYGDLADGAGRGQVSGMQGVSEKYLGSEKFLATEGGWSAVVWISPGAREAAVEGNPELDLEAVPGPEPVDIEELKVELEKD